MGRRGEQDMVTTHQENGMRELDLPVNDARSGEWNVSTELGYKGSQSSVLDLFVPILV